ncbi:MAG: hypothetical protein ACI87E_004751 [Mariniblastus sp.]
MTKPVNERPSLMPRQYWSMPLPAPASRMSLSVAG